MMLQVNSPFARSDASRSRSGRRDTDLSQQLKDSIDECNQLRQALHTLNDSSLNYKNNAERALELAKKELTSLKSQVAEAANSKQEVNKLRAQIVRLQRSHRSSTVDSEQKVLELEATIVQLRDEARLFALFVLTTVATHVL